MNAFLIVALLFSGILTFNLTNYFIKTRMKGRYGLGEIPFSVHFLKCIHFLTAAILISEISVPMKDIQMVLMNSYTGFDLAVQLFTYFSVFLAIVWVVLFVLFWIAMIIHMVISKTSNPIQSAIQEDNGSLVLYAGIAIGMSIIIRPGISELLEGIIPVQFAPVLH